MSCGAKMSTKSNESNESNETTEASALPSAGLSERPHAALAGLLGLSHQELTEASEDARSEAGYLRYELPKGNGKVRVINAPSERLKRAQRAILDQLLSRVPVSPFSHGFAIGKSIITNARVHAATARAVLNLDLQDAFPSVSAERVRRLLEWRVGPLLKVALPSLSPTERAELYEELTALCCRDGALPQGAPTSGYLLNLACARLDRKVYGLAMRSGLPQVRYSRYADDLTLTSSAPIPPEFHLSVIRAITQSGFRVNPHKVHSYSDAQRAIVICGVRLHRGRLALPGATLKRYRALINAVASTPSEEVDEVKRGEVMGVLGFLRHIYPSCPAPLLKPLNRLILAHPSWVKLPRERDDKATYRSFTYADLQAMSLKTGGTP